MTTTIVVMLAVAAVAGTATPQRLDGRESKPVSGDPALTPLRLALLPVRGASWLVLKPIEVTTAAVERGRWYERAYELTTSDDRLRGVRPSLRYDTGLALAVGLRVFDRRTLGPDSLLEASARAGVGNTHAAVAVELGRLGLELRGGYDHRSDAVFGGTRGESREELEAQGLDVARYSNRIAAASLGWFRPLWGPVGAGARAAVERRTYGNGRERRGDEPIFDVYCIDPNVEPCTVDPVLVPGFEEGLRVVKGEVGLTLDTHAHPRFSSGVQGALLWSLSQGIAGDPSEYHAGVGQLAGALAFGDRAIAARVRTGYVDEIGTDAVPFEALLTASGEGGVRGLSTGRLRGHTILVGSAEYRWLLNPWLDAVLSIDRGGAFGPRFNDLAWDRLFTSYAVGIISVNPRTADHARAESRFGAQIAFTPDDGVRVSLALSAW